MDGQLIAVAAAGLLAAGYLFRSAWRTWFGPKSGCGSGCGKCSTPPAADAGSKGRISLPQV